MKPNKDKIAKALALAFFEIEEENKGRQQSLLALQKIVGFIDKTPKLQSFLANPMFSFEEKELFFSLARPSKKVVLFLKLITERGMISHLKTIVNQYENSLFAATGKMKAKVVVARSSNVSPNIETLFIAKLEKLMNQKIELNFHVDPSILGGFQLETNNCYMDASLKKTLDDIRHSL